MKYFEDYQVGQESVLPFHTVTADEIIAFAKQYDPQYFHLDPEAAKQSIFGGLVASGWHVCAILMRMLVEELKHDQAAGLGSPGVDSCRWLKPVRPGDRLSGRGVVLDAWRSKSKPYGFVRRRFDLSNQHGEIVASLVGLGMFAVRPDAGAS